MKHAHTWGTKTRQPRPGDLCLTCPCEWSERGRGGQFMTDDYKPRTVAHHIERVYENAEQPGSMAGNSNGRSVLATPPAVAELPELEAPDMAHVTRSAKKRKARAA